MLLVGVEDFPAGLCPLPLLGRRDGEIDQVIVVVDPDVQDRFHLHLFGIGVVRPHLLSHLQCPDRLLSHSRRHYRRRDEAKSSCDTLLNDLGRIFARHLADIDGPLLGYLRSDACRLHRLPSSIEHVNVHDNRGREIPKRPRLIPPTRIRIGERLYIMIHP